MKLFAIKFTMASAAAVAPLASAAGAAYFLTNSDKANHIVASVIGDDGKLSAGTATFAGGVGSGHTDAGFDALFAQGPLLAKGSNVFAVNPGSNTIAMFTMDAADPTKLTMVGQPVSSQGEFPQSIAIHPTSGNICVLNGGKVNNVACFTPDPEQGLVAIAGTLREIGITQSTPPMGPPNTVTQVMFTLDGKRLVASVKGIPPAQPGFLAVWDVAADGSLSTGYSAITAPPGGALPFSLSTLPHNPSVIVATDPAIGFEVVDLNGSLRMANNGTTAIPSAAVKHVMASGVSSSMAVPGQGAICWSAFSPLTGNFYLIDPGTNTVTEVTVNSATYKPTMIKQYDSGANGNILDAEVATVNGKDYLYIIAPNRTSIDVFSLRAYGLAQKIQSFDFTQSITGDADLVPTRVVGMTAIWA
ncbi:hypothetical protein EXIGLDRAFT_666077 [Exidia glandulosa HHB12029]|uniref:3-carboxymuconate cyclase n=1 Tax=Exidia glandulosa HHB12029 TaxID=1314781 RepID=A0A165PB27_EXIGL|nr:hypothetical protein EXIGLDRAFT_666077 [Exidia glandulosa HHB12029]